MTGHMPFSDFARLQDFKTSKNIRVIYKKYYGYIRLGSHPNNQVCYFLRKIVQYEHFWMLIPVLGIENVFQII